MIDDRTFGAWLPIESAPQDGTHVLVCFGGRPFDQYWTFQQRPPTVAHWFGPADLPGLRSGGWYLSVQQNEGPKVDPTHWSPLPLPPTDSPPVVCAMCDDTGYKDYAGFSMDPCDHARPCQECGGDGGHDYPTGIDYRDGGLIEQWRACVACNGSGHDYPSPEGAAPIIPSDKEIDNG